MGCALFMAGENEFKRRMVKAGEYVQYGPSGQTENCFHTRFLDTIHYALSTGSHSFPLVSVDMVIKQKNPPFCLAVGVVSLSRSCSVNSASAFHRDPYGSYKAQIKPPKYEQYQSRDRNIVFHDKRTILQ